MTIMSGRKSAEEFDSLLRGDAALEEYRADLVELTEVVTALREHTQVTPRPDFSATLRERLMAEAPLVLNGDSKSLALPVRTRGSRERRLTVAAAAFVLVGGSAGMATASQSSLPGDTLYPIKRTIERAQTQLHTSDTGKGNDLIGQADDRLREVEAMLAESSKTTLVPGTLDDFTSQATQAAALLSQAYDQNDDPAPIQDLRGFAARSLTTLQELAKTADPRSQESLAEAARTILAIDQQAMSLCSICADDLPPLTVTNIVTVADVDSVKEALEKAADSAKLNNGRLGDEEKSAAETPPTTPAPVAPTQEPKPTKGDKPTKKAPLVETLDETTEQLEETVTGLLPTVGGLLGGLLGGSTE